MSGKRSALGSMSSRSSNDIFEVLDDMDNIDGLHSTYSNDHADFLHNATKRTKTTNRLKEFEYGIDGDDSDDENDTRYDVTQDKLTIDPNDWRSKEVNGYEGVKFEKMKGDMEEWKRDVDKQVLENSWTKLPIPWNVSCCGGPLVNSSSDSTNPCYSVDAIFAKGFGKYKKGDLMSAFCNCSLGVYTAPNYQTPK